MFKEFKARVKDQFTEMSQHELFVTDISKDEMWETYLKSFPESTNPIFHERTEHDCNCCKQFIRTVGNVVSVIDNKLVSIWDIKINSFYQVVSDAMSKLVREKPILNVFVHYENNVGTDMNRQLLTDGGILEFHHFHQNLPNKVVKHKDQIGPFQADKVSTKQVLQRGLEEISMETLETILELIAQNSIYRGNEFEASIQSFKLLKETYDKIKEKDNYCWCCVNLSPTFTRIRNTSIGTLLCDVSGGMELDEAIRLFESKVAPTNYKRPTAIITKSMIENAQNKVKELGIEDSLVRRHSVIGDISINNILFADRTSKKAMSAFDELKKSVSTNMKQLDKVDEVSIEDFISKILPKAENLELLLENRHTNNMVSLISPVHPEAPSIFKWGNNCSWSYNGEVTDSIKERVKKAGGKVDGDMRCSLSWFNTDDLDIHVEYPSVRNSSGYPQHIYFGHKNDPYNLCKLDVDMNAGRPLSRNAVENITWLDKSEIAEGEYHLYIHNYLSRETVDVGFNVEIEYDGIVHNFHYDKRVNGNVTVARWLFSRKDGIKFIEALPNTQPSKDLWNVPTGTFKKVSLMMHSPNYWDGRGVGNKHYFFILDSCKNGGSSRGFYNEFLKEELSEHRKVFEVLGSKMKVEPSDDQLSGIGFSSTQKNHVFCKVTGSFTRTIKINF